jgi:hypothetical protein
MLNTGRFLVMDFYLVGLHTYLTSNVAETPLAAKGKESKNQPRKRGKDGGRDSKRRLAPPIDFIWH